MASPCSHKTTYCLKHNVVRELDEAAPLVLAGRAEFPFLAAQPALVLPVPEHGRHGGREVEAVLGWDDDEAVAVADVRLRDAPVLGAEDVDGVRRGLEAVQGLRVLPHLDRDGDGGLELLEGVVVVDDLHVRVTLHPLLARQPPPVRNVERDALAREPDLLQPVTGGQPHDHADVVRVLRVDEHHGRPAPRRSLLPAQDPPDDPPLLHTPPRPDPNLDARTAPRAAAKKPRMLRRTLSLTEGLPESESESYFRLCSIGCGAMLRAGGLRDR